LIRLIFLEGPQPEGCGYLGNGDVYTVNNDNSMERNAYFSYDPMNRLAKAWSESNSGADCSRSPIYLLLASA
jgi:hypothetical protein